MSLPQSPMRRNSAWKNDDVIAGNNPTKYSPHVPALARPGRNDPNYGCWGAAPSLFQPNERRHAGLSATLTPANAPTDPGRGPYPAGNPVWRLEKPNDRTDDAEYRGPPTATDEILAGAGSWCGNVDMRLPSMLVAALSAKENAGAGDDIGPGRK